VNGNRLASHNARSANAVEASQHWASGETRMDRKRLVALSSVALGAAMFILSITDTLSASGNFALRSAAIVFGLGGLFFVLFLSNRRSS
jgi:hypothetical protein